MAKGKRCAYQYRKNFSLIGLAVDIGGVSIISYNIEIEDVMYRLYLL